MFHVEQFHFINQMTIKLIQAKSILNQSKAFQSYTLNPYSGCPHGCVYCYNLQFIQRFKPDQKWGQFMEVKINAPDILEKEVKRKPKNDVFFSTITDAYNPLEQKYQITQKCLKILLEHQWPINILTKSDLILRDIELIKGFKQKKVGFSLINLDPKIAKILEPGTSSPEKRLLALQTIHQAGIPTYAFVGPILPYITDLPLIFKNLVGKVDEVLLDTFNTAPANWQNFKNALEPSFPELIPKCQELLFQKRRIYENNVRQEILKLNQQFKLPIKICF